MNEKTTGKSVYPLVLCDTYDYEDFPSYVSKYDNIYEVINIYNSKDFIRVMEVYNLQMNLEDQIYKQRAWNL